eukprot:5471792-Prymnesium_polylepis.1
MALASGRCSLALMGSLKGLRRRSSKLIPWLLPPQIGRRARRPPRIRLFAVSHSPLRKSAYPAL